MVVLIVLRVDADWGQLFMLMGVHYERVIELSVLLAHHCFAHVRILMLMLRLLNPLHVVFGSGIQISSIL